MGLLNNGGLHIAAEGLKCSLLGLDVHHMAVSLTLGTISGSNLKLVDSKTITAVSLAKI